jgi:hypothetical protein
MELIVCSTEEMFHSSIIKLVIKNAYSPEGYEMYHYVHFFLSKTEPSATVLQNSYHNLLLMAGNEPTVSFLTFNWTGWYSNFRTQFMKNILSEQRNNIMKLHGIL